VLTEGAIGSCVGNCTHAVSAHAANCWSEFENPLTGDLLLDELHAGEFQRVAARKSGGSRRTGAAGLKNTLRCRCSRRSATGGIAVEQYMARGGPLAVTGAEGWGPPLTGAAGTYCCGNLSEKLPAPAPTVRPRGRERAVRQKPLERDPPYGANTSVLRLTSSSGGWNAHRSPWLSRSMQRASRHAFSDATQSAWAARRHASLFKVLGERFRQTQFYVTGVLATAPRARTHEFPHIGYDDAADGRREHGARRFGARDPSLVPVSGRNTCIHGRAFSLVHRSSAGVVGLPRSLEIKVGRANRRRLAAIECVLRAMRFIFRRRQIRGSGYAPGLRLL